MPLVLMFLSFHFKRYFFFFGNWNVLHFRKASLTPNTCTCPTEQSTIWEPQTTSIHWFWSTIYSPVYGSELYSDGETVRSGKSNPGHTHAWICIRMPDGPFHDLWASKSVARRSWTTGNSLTPDFKATKLWKGRSGVAVLLKRFTWFYPRIIPFPRKQAIHACAYVSLSAFIMCVSAYVRNAVFVRAPTNCLFPPSCVSSYSPDPTFHTFRDLKIGLYVV